MKQILFPVFFVLAMAAMFTAASQTPAAGLVDTTAPAQTPTLTAHTDAAPATLSAESLMSKESSVFAVLVLLFGFFSNRIPVLKKINEKSLRVLAIALTLGVGLLVYRFSQNGSIGWGDVASIGLNYVLATLGYDKFLKPLGAKSPQGIPAPAAKA